ncbi:MAG: hypothetical protein GY730_04515 [bacterium]|nr:hypothetical protein [bacterium]
MKKYTVYEIEKLTKGRLTKYKLNQAIKTKEIKAEKVNSKKNGKGVPKYYITENDLQNYLEKVEEQKKKMKIIADESRDDGVLVSNEIKEIYTKLIEQKDSIIDSQGMQIKELTKKVSMLENNRVLVADAPEDYQEKQCRRKELLMELANNSIFTIGKRKKILKELNKLS